MTSCLGVSAICLGFSVPSVPPWSMPVIRIRRAFSHRTVVGRRYSSPHMPELNYQNTGDARRETWKQARMSLFGPGRAEVWSRLAEEVGGAFEPGQWFRGRDKVTATVGPWTVVLDHYVVSHGESSTTYTRLRAPYVNADGFRFLIFRKHLFSGVAKWLGFQDVEV